MPSRTQARASDESRPSLDELRYALDQAAIVAVTDQCGVITYANDRFCELSQYSRAELIGQDHRIVNSGLHTKDFMRDLWQTIAHGRIWRGEIRNRAKGGSFYWVDTTIVPLLDASGKPRQYLAIRYDITARKQAEAELRTQSALTQLGQIAAVVAHEVRNPLAGLRATLQVIGPRASSAGDRAAMSAMIERIDDLNAKISDLLLYAHPRPPHRQAVDLRNLMLEVAKGARAAVNPSAAPVTVVGDSCSALADIEMLRASMLNLVINACQAATTGEVDIVVSDDVETCRVVVRDRGPGIPDDARDRIFEPFFTTRPHGTGLGLAVVKRFVELQGGTVSIASRPGGGTLAEVRLPRAGA
jgi:PAS domain S-box-containing protein